MNSNHYIVILAGGKGERLWPLSRQAKPKQLLPFERTTTLLEQTVARIESLVLAEQIWVITTKEHEQEIKNKLGSRVGRVLAEPLSRNTAPAILYTCLAIKEKNPEALVAFLPADHVIKPEQEFTNALQTAMSFAHHHRVIALLGLKPTYAATGYGYIEYEPNHHDLSPILHFHEKPLPVRAQEYIEKPNMLWNIGIFCASVSIFLHEFELHAFELFKKINKFYTTGNGYEEAQSISIDYAVIEKSNETVVLPVQFEWSDVGNLDVFLTAQKQKLPSQVISIDSENNLVDVADKLVALIGVNDLCIVQTHDTLVIAKRSEVEKVKLVVQQLQKNKQEKYL